MTLLLQVSDPHFGTERPAVVEALVRLSHEQKPDVLVLSGDITQRAHRSQFQAARAFVDRLGIPHRLVIPGNHDIPLFNLAARVLAPYAGLQASFGDVLEPEFASDGVLVIGVNTTRRWRHEDGEVSAAQVERVAARLSRAGPAQWRVVVTHQPVFVTQPRDHKNLLHGREAAVARWAQAGADVVMGGHIHLPYVAPLQEAFGGLARPMWAVQAGTAVSHRVRHGAENSVNLLRCSHEAGRRSCSVERWDFVAAEDRFVRVKQDVLVSEDAAHGH
jgi:3',5'-cyclic AMP phosphodiesterase CpdA